MFAKRINTLLLFVEQDQNERTATSFILSIDYEELNVTFTPSCDFFKQL